MLILASLSAVAAMGFVQQKIVVLVDNKPVEFRNEQPQTVQGRVMVPLRGVFEAIGAMVQYDPANHTIEASRNNESVGLRLGSKVAKKNGAEILLDVPPRVISGTTMVPLRFIAESMGAKVTFDKANNRVMIMTQDVPVPNPSEKTG
ncbi:hypothetical protein BH11ARM2_BH11ARM2_32530 [soil metagenome]